VVSSTGRWSLTGARAAVFLNAIEPYLRLKQGHVHEVVNAGMAAPHKAATLRKMYDLGWPHLEAS
jgi:electron transfer flavoprotein alpha/beta subunit